MATNPRLPRSTPARTSSATIDAWLRRALNPAIHVLAWLPGLWLAYGWFADALGVNPVQRVLQETGLRGLQLLVLSLLCTPLILLTRLSAFNTVRRALGLYGFFYVSAHLLTFAWLDFGLDLGLIALEITEKPYIVAGLTAFALLIPLAITSTRGWIRRLGPRWKTLHRLVYLIVPIGVLHFWWALKQDLNEALLIYAPLVLILLVFRLPAVRRRFGR
jgi:methionine sulfoxide reductase heme-binding subunit